MATLTKIKVNGVTYDIGGSGGDAFSAELEALQAQITKEKADREAQDNAIIAAVSENIANLGASDRALQSQINTITATLNSFIDVSEVGA